jgi:hypothetical protein
MSKLDTFLSVANIGISAANWSKLHQMQDAQQTSAVIQAIIQMAREMAFKLKQSAEDSVALEDHNPKLAAVRLQLIVLAFDDLGISPGLFPDLSDKEYVAGARRYAVDNERRIAGSLSSSDHQETQEIVEAVQQTRDCEFYIENAPEAQKLRTAQATYNELQGRNSKASGCVVWLIMSVGLMFLFQFAVMNNLFFGILAFALLIGGFVGVLVWQRPRDFKQAKKTLDQIDRSDFDLTAYSRVEKQYGFSSTQDARKLLDTISHRVNAFFGQSGTSFLPG